MEGLSIGRDVHFIDDDGEHCAAKVTDVLDRDEGIATLFVMDRHGKLYTKFCVPHEAVAVEAINSWHWPERV